MGTCEMTVSGRSELYSATQLEPTITWEDVEKAVTHGVILVPRCALQPGHASTYPDHSVYTSNDTSMRRVGDCRSNSQAYDGAGRHVKVRIFASIEHVVHRASSDPQPLTFHIHAFNSISERGVELKELLAFPVHAVHMCTAGNKDFAGCLARLCHWHHCSNRPCRDRQAPQLLWWFAKHSPVARACSMSMPSATWQAAAHIPELRLLVGLDKSAGQSHHQ